MYHLVWISKYRKRVLTGLLAVRLKKLFEQSASVHKWEVSELSIQPDHVHMLVQLRPDVSISMAMQLLKGGNSKVIRSEFPDLEEFLWGARFWSDAYFAETIGVVNEAKFPAYIKNQ